MSDIRNIEDLHINYSGKATEYKGIKYICTFPEKKTTEEEWEKFGQKIYSILRPSQNN